MPLVESFPPVIGTHPKVLILGSMPGTESLRLQQYYAHPRNGFWPVMSALFDCEWAEDYEQRITQFCQLPLALWDSLQSCRREGSLDSSIESDDLVANDIPGLLYEHPSIGMIAFNGAASEKYFRKYVLSSIGDTSGLELTRLPSTSPAHASLSLEQKIKAWRAIKTYIDQIA